ncbi:MAG: arsenic resistance protein [Candidatus Paceibacterota bacterium]
MPQWNNKSAPGGNASVMLSHSLTAKPELEANQPARCETNMSTLDKLQSVFILLAVAVGLALGQIPQVSMHAGSLIVPFLMLMLTGVFLHVPLRGLGEAFGNLRFTGWNLGVNFLWTPFFGWLLGLVFLTGQPELRVGLLMLLVTPCTDWYLVFTQLTGGNVRLATAQLPWHLILQLLLLPVYLLIFVGAIVPIDLGILVESVLLVLVVPLCAATLIRAIAIRARGQSWFEAKVLSRIAPAQLTFLLLAIGAMFASQGSALLDRLDLFLRLLPPLLVFFGVNLVLGLVIARFVLFDRGDCVALCFATLARNSPVSLAIAVVAFPDRPLIALALVIGPLIELPVLAIISQLLKAALHSRGVEEGATS